MMYLSRLTLNRSRTANYWAANAYRIHQRMMMACEGDERVLFRVEEQGERVCILVQTQEEPVWEKAFSDLPVLDKPAECKAFDLKLVNGQTYRFRLLANPTVKKTVEKEGEEKRKTRLGVLGEAEQRAWLERKLMEAGGEILECRVVRQAMQYAYKSGQNEEGGRQAHLAVLYEGVLRANDAALLRQAVESGIGSGKGYGFGLLSLGHIREEE